MLRLFWQPPAVPKNKPHTQPNQGLMVCAIIESQWTCTHRCKRSVLRLKHKPEQNKTKNSQKQMNKPHENFRNRLWETQAFFSFFPKMLLIPTYSVIWCWKLTSNNFLGIDLCKKLIVVRNMIWVRNYLCICWEAKAVPACFGKYQAPQL